MQARVQRRMHRGLREANTLYMHISHLVTCMLRAVYRVHRGLSSSQLRVAETAVSPRTRFPFPCAASARAVFQVEYMVSYHA